MAGPLGYWHWEERGPMPGGASALNPLGWFLTSLGVGFLLSKLSAGNARVAATVLGGHIGLTLGIGAIAMIPR